MTMASFDKIIQDGIKQAIQHYWKTRTGQLKPGRRGGKVRDQGKRAEVTGGKQLDGFLWVVRDLLKEAGIADAQVFTGQMDSYLPGYFRPTKRWDLLAIADRNLLACIEVKSHAGPSYGNNFKAGGLKGEFIEPSEELSFRRLAAAVYGRAVAYCKQR